MTPEQLSNSDLDRLIKSVLAADDHLTVPSGLSDKIVRKLEKKALLRELVVELAGKTGLVIASLAILAGVLIWTNNNSILAGLYSFLGNNWKVLFSLLLLLFITIIIDQVGLRFYHALNKEADLKS
jgi:hypothetical protein